MSTEGSISQESLAFVVASTPRSGTMFASRFLSALGLACDHESSFGTDGPQAPAAGVVGESSWLSVPFLRTLPATTALLHQVRDPIATMNSLIYTGHVDLMLESNPYIAFIRRYVPFEDFDANRRDLAIEFWWRWHTMIESSGTGKTYVRYRVEDLDERFFVTRILPSLRDGVSPTRSSADVPVNLNTRGKTYEAITMDRLPRRVRELAVRYGYERYAVDL